MNKSEIAERAAREIRHLVICEDCKTRGIPGTKKFNWPLCDWCIREVDKIQPVIEYVCKFVERAIAESQVPQPPNSQLCTCHSGYNQFCCRHGLNGYFQRKEKSEKTELGDGEPSAPPALAHSAYLNNSGVITGISDRVDLMRDSSLDTTTTRSPCGVQDHADAAQIVGEQSPELGDGEPSPRTDQDYAIEHGGYLADAVMQYLTARNHFDEKESTGDCDEGECDLLNDCRRALINAVGEFRKRAKRVSGAAQEVSPPSPVCKAQRTGVGGNDPIDCDWPFCGCDPKADKVIKAIQESGFDIVKTGGDTRELKAALTKIEENDSSCECDDHTQPECCANVPVSDCFCARCIAGKALL